jgi:hypothetical protein
VLDCVFGFVDTTPFAFTQSVKLRSERMKGCSNGLADLARPAGQVWYGLFALGLFALGLFALGLFALGLCLAS